MDQRTVNCLYAVADCRTEDGPVVSTDCGINDPVVRAWGQSRWRNVADPATPPQPVLVGICEEGGQNDA